MWENQIHEIITVNEMKFSYMREVGTIDTVLILRRMQEDHCAKRNVAYVR